MVSLLVLLVVALGLIFYGSYMSSRKPKSAVKKWRSAAALAVGGFLLHKFRVFPLRELALAAPLLWAWLEGEKPAAASPYASKEGMSQEDARRILGVSPSAQPDEIQEAYRKLMQKNHPDQGGSHYLASKINQARETLLKK